MIPVAKSWEYNLKLKFCQSLFDSINLEPLRYQSEKVESSGSVTKTADINTRLWLPYTEIMRTWKTAGFSTLKIPGSIIFQLIPLLEFLFPKKRAKKLDRHFGSVKNIYGAERAQDRFQIWNIDSEKTRNLTLPLFGIFAIKGIHGRFAS